MSNCISNTKRKFLTPYSFWWCLCIILLVFCLNTPKAFAASLAERLEAFPQWQSKPTLKVVQGDLVYPNWMAGTWDVTSTLVDLVAPLAPDIVTPGFEGNRQYLHQPVGFVVKFVPQPFTIALPFVLLPNSSRPIVSDRAFNGLHIAKAYLGDRSVASVNVDWRNPNQQITVLRGENQLISTVTGRNWENPNPDEFIATEVTNQVFRTSKQIYINEVETTTAYSLISPDSVEADQVTAIYLSPQDPDYFTASGTPVALYRYHLQLEVVN